MEKQEGITLIILVITIIVLLILLTAGIAYGRNTIDNIKMYQFSSELQIVQKKLGIIYEERALGSKAYDTIGTKYNDLEQVKKDKGNLILKGLGFSEKDIGEFRLLTKTDLEKIGVNQIEQEVLINYNIPMVVSYTGITIDGITYYVQNGK